MGSMDDPFERLAIDETAADSTASQCRPPRTRPQPQTEAAGKGAHIARLDGFDLDDRPLVSGMTDLPGEVVSARTTIPLLREMIGAEVVVLCEEGDPQCPIIVGIIRSRSPSRANSVSPKEPVSIQADEDRYLISAEREIVLRCGDSSITLTRAGKVIIKGNYILSRSQGYNKIKGAAVDIN